MPFPHDNSSGRIAVFFAIVILSLGLANESLGQMMGSPKGPLTPPKKSEGLAVWYNVPLNSRAQRRVAR